MPATEEQRLGGVRTVGRYVLYEAIAAGGMAIVHLGRLLGPVGFARTVAIKRVHPNFAHDREFVAMFVDEAHIAGRIHHPNVVATLDVVVDGAEVLLVMEYVHGESLSKLMRLAQGNSRLPLRVASAILTGVLHGLHAAHETRNEQGEPLGVVHRDVSPQNVIVGADGVTRVLDFGVAKASGGLHTTREGRIRGKLAYMAPEQLHSEPLTRRADVYSAAVLAWEVVTGRRLFQADSEGGIVTAILEGKIAPPSTHAPDLPASLDALILRGLDRDPAKRFATAREMALALELCVPPALGSEVAETVERLAGETLRERARVIAAMEGGAPPAADQSASREVAALARAPEGVTESQVSIGRVLAANKDSRPRRLRAAILLGFVVVAIPAAALAVLRGRAPAAPAPRDSAPPPVASAVAITPVTSASSEPVPPDPNASTAAPRRSAPSKTHPLAAGRGAHASAAGASATANPCDPPFTVDSIGRRVYRRECF